MAKIMERRDLGVYTVMSDAGVKTQIRICINLQRLAEALGGRAVRSRTKRYRLLHNTILLEQVP